MNSAKSRFLRLGIPLKTPATKKSPQWLPALSYEPINPLNLKSNWLLPHCLMKTWQPKIKWRSRKIILQRAQWPGTCMIPNRQLRSTGCNPGPTKPLGFKPIGLNRLNATLHLYVPKAGLVTCKLRVTSPVFLE